MSKFSHEKRSSNRRPGGKPAIFLLHGWTLKEDTEQKWQPLIQQLSRAGYRTQFLKLPGLQADLDQIWTLEDYRDWLLEQIQAEPSVVLIGHSFGGQIAASAAAAQPQNLEKLVLIGPAGKRDQAFLKKTKRAVFKTAAQLGKSVLGQGKLAALARKFIYKAAREQDYYQASPKLKKTMVNVIESEIVDQLPQIKAPALLIWGRQDRYTPFKHAQLFKNQIENCQLIALEAGHSSHYYQPKLVGEKILQFLEK